MDDSTEGVTLFAGFIFDVLQEYRGAMLKTCAPAWEMASHLDANAPTALVPIRLYNEICDWIEGRLGKANVRDAGRAIGARAYGQMIKDGKLGASPSPQVILAELKRVASLMIQDPRGRGWEILEMGDRRAVLRRTQTFNCMLQEGLLVSLVERTGVMLPQARHLRCTRTGAEFCDYEITWTPRGASGKDDTKPRRVAS